MTTCDALVIGEALIDITHGVEGTVAEHVGGSPANVALGLGRLGRSVALLTQLGDDPHGAQTRGHLEHSRVRVIGPRAARTSTATATIRPGGHATYDFDIAWDAFAPPTDIQARLVHTGSIAAFLQPGADSVLHTLANQPDDTIISLDPNIRPALTGDPETAVHRFAELSGIAHLVKLSDEDADFLYPCVPHDAVLDLLLSRGVRLAAITRGGEGAILASARARVTVPAVRVDVVDTIGAGDTFMVGLIDRYLHDDSLDGAALTALGAFAAGLASQTVSRAGANLPWKEDVRASDLPA